MSLLISISILLSAESFCELSQNSSVVLYPIRTDFTTPNEDFCELSQFHAVEFIKEIFQPKTATLKSSAYRLTCSYLTDETLLILNQACANDFDYLQRRFMQKD